MAPVAWVLHDDKWQMSRAMRTIVQVSEEWLPAYRARVVEEGGRIIAIYRLKALAATSNGEGS